MNSACLRDYILFDHQAAHVVGTIEEGQLADLETLGDPTGLNVRNVIQVKPGNGLGFQVLKGTGWGNL